MKPTLLAVAALIAGTAIGITLTRNEFKDDAAIVNIDLPLGNRETPEAGASTQTPTAKGPKVNVVNGERHYFGSMDRNAHGSHAFILRNDGDMPLRLEMGQPTCKCTVGALRKDTLGPGETVEVKLEWDAKTVEEKFEQSVPFTTNDPSRRTLHLSVVGNVIDAVRPQSNEIHFNDVSRNEPSVATVPIHAFRDESLAIEKVEMLNAEQADYFDVSFEPMTPSEVASVQEATGGLMMKIVLKAGFPAGRIEQTIRLTTNIRPEEPLEINVLGNAASDILLAGPRVVADRKLVVLPHFARAEGIKHTVYLVVKGPFRDETELRIDSVEPPVEFSAELGEPMRSNPRVVRYPLTIAIPPNATPVGRLSEGSEAKIRIATTHPEEKELTVLVRYFVRAE